MNHNARYHWPIKFKDMHLQIDPHNLLMYGNSKTAELFHEIYRNVTIMQLIEADSIEPNTPKTILRFVALIYAMCT